MVTEAVVLAGGLGTRLKSVIQEVPKPMADVNGRPFLEYVLDQVADAGFDHIVLSTGYQAGMIRRHFGDSYRNMRITYSEEDVPLGTGGAVKKALEVATENTVLVCNGDSLYKADLGALHALHAAEHADVTIALRPHPDASRYGRVETDERSRITAFREKDPSGGPGIINGGIYLVERKKFLAYTAGKPAAFSIEKDVFAAGIGQLKICGLVLDGYFIDIGIPEDYARAQHELKGA
jgi:D-glycero-alpha-D-manno-heptose 1-phosphate guanylyltransferase